LSETFKNMCKLLGIKKIQSVSFRPQPQGSLERTHRNLMEYIRNYVVMLLRNWDQWARYATFTDNTTPQTSTNYMPFQLLYGRLPNLSGILRGEQKIRTIPMTVMSRN
jgi:hypothetical protein